MEVRIARIVSYALHPLLMPTLAYVLMLNFDAFYSFLIPVNVKLLLIGMIFFTTFVLPATMNYFLLQKGIIRSFQMETREERLFPFMITAIFFYLSAYLVRSFHLPGLFYLFSLCSTMLVVISLFINFALKTSIHMTGIGGLTGTFLALSFKWVTDFRLLIIVLFLLAGIIGWSRLRLKAHRPLEIYIGYGTGFLLMFLIFYLL